MKQFNEKEIRSYYEDDKKYFVHADNSVSAQQNGSSLIYKAAKGNYLYTIDGREILDATAGLALANIGHGNEEVARAAYDQYLTLDYNQNFFEFASLKPIELAKKISELSPIDNSKVFFVSGGSEANDTMYKFIRYYWYCKNQDSKDFIISRDKAYHGLSYGSMSATGLQGMREGFGPMNPGHAHINAPHCYYCPHGLDKENCHLECAVELETKILELGQDNVAAFVAEPIHGVGGYLTPPEGYYEKIREICDKHNILFAVDEVISGFGRTGKMFGILHWDVKPDLIAFAKGVTSAYFPVGGVIFPEYMYKAFGSKHSLDHGFTYGGHPVGCAVALKNLEIIEKNDLIERADKMGNMLIKGLREIAHPAIGEVRGKGLMVGIEMIKNKETKEKFDDYLSDRVVALAYERGVNIRNTPGDVIEISPPFTVTEEEIDRIVKTTGECIEIAYKEFMK
ncbi:aspartate aminotransferase family protein [Acidaminobacter sp. JC074]|uniref:aminotransferase family protein n=1 Tax=Acidaminobacter sp. JC074 TaxID=2530199 RepID=UPI001F10E6AB|nr:aspartate aminotransferase family protein [Acidaminobacter sp. JC074]MCH4890171.1 aspartate aminotransferase family protein [Acidaminobacter sp. JC074]